MNRRNFLGLSATALAAQSLHAIPSDPSSKHAEGINIRFLGTGAADWNGPDNRGEHRRLTSLLVNNHILIDYTSTVRDMIPEGAMPDTIFYTHSHHDHYDPTALLQLGTVRTVYMSSTWYDLARAEFTKAAKELKVETPVLVPVCIGQQLAIGDITFTPLPANHVTDHLLEQTLFYLLERNNVRLLYATDTGGLPAVATRMAGIDAHVPGKPITALIMEATMGIEHEVDFRLFGHSSVALVKRTVDVLMQTKRYAPKDGLPVYITHLARTLHGTQAELDATLPHPLRAAYDGLEVQIT